MPAPATHDFVHLEISSASVLNTGVNGPIEYLAGRELGGDDAIELEESLEILSGNGRRYLRLPQGSSGQRPSGVAARLRYNTNGRTPEIYDGSQWFSLDLRDEVTYGNLNGNGDVGVGASQVARGQHEHLGAYVLREGPTTAGANDSRVTLFQFNADPPADERWGGVFLARRVDGGVTSDVDRIYLYKDNVATPVGNIAGFGVGQGWSAYYFTAYNPSPGSATWSMRWGFDTDLPTRTLEWKCVIIPYHV